MKKYFKYLTDNLNCHFDKLHPLVAMMFLLIPIGIFIWKDVPWLGLVYYMSFMLWRGNHQKKKVEEFNKTHITIPIKPSNGLLFSMAMRYDHSFGMDCQLTDEEIMKERSEGNFFANSYKTKREKESIISTMKQLHEEVVGIGFYKYEK